MRVRLSTIPTVRAAAVCAAAVVTLGLGLASCDDPRPTESVAPRDQPDDPHLTMGSGSTRTYLGQGTYTDLDKVKRIEKDWHVELKAKGGLEILIQTFAYAPGAITGWHKHPGPVFIQVIEGTVAFYEADDPTCTPKLVSAGQGYLDRGDGHIGRNLSGQPAKDITVYFAPPGTTAAQLRIDIPEAEAPKQCGF